MWRLSDSGSRAEAAAGGSLLRGDVNSFFFAANVYFKGPKKPCVLGDIFPQQQKLHLTRSTLHSLTDMPVHFCYFAGAGAGKCRGTGSRGQEGDAPPVSFWCPPCPLRFVSHP